MTEVGEPEYELIQVIDRGIGCTYWVLMEVETQTALYVFGNPPWPLEPDPDADRTPPSFAKPLAPLPDWLKKVDKLIEESK